LIYQLSIQRVKFEAVEENDKVNVLYIDDEVNNLNSFKATFRFDYNIFLASNIVEAEEHLNNPDNNIEIILSDQRMPEITGVEFFEKIRISHPQCIRLLITGFSDIESVIDAVNRGHIFRYIKKPWIELDIKSAIKEGYNYYAATTILAETNKSLEKAYSELNKFAYSVAHDFKGPITSIRSALSIVNANEQNEENKELIGLIISSAEKLSDFIDSMFDYYRLNQGELTMEDIDFNEIASYYNDLFAIEAKLKNVDFQIEIHQTQKFRSDETKLKLILNNLINNAFKYLKQDSTQGVIKVQIEVSDEAKITISDNGIGIAEKYVGSIFDMFFRATTQAVGSGFGLYNVKDAITKLDGNIRVMSTLDEGTSFTVTLKSK